MVRRLVWIVLFVIMLSPALVLSYLSLTTAWVFPKLLDVEFSLDKWKSILSSENQLLFSLGLSIFISTIVAFLATITAFLISKKLLMDYNMKSWLKWIYYPYLIAPVIFGAMLQYYFVRVGLMGTITGVMMSQFIFIFPYAITLFSTFWNAKIKDMTHCAYTLGTSKIQIYKLLLPLAKPFIILCFLQCFLISWFEYGITQMIGVGNVKTLTIQTMKYINSSDLHASALSSLLLVYTVWCIILIVFLLSRINLRKSI